MRLAKRRVLPNSKELVVNYNKRAPPETIPEHNDPLRIDWTDLPPNPRLAPEIITGKEALRIPEDSNPPYKLTWPMQYGWINEKDYDTKWALYRDIYLIIEHALKNELGLTRRKDWQQYRCMFVVPDLYDRNYVTQMLDGMLREFFFERVCLIQESLAASFGAGFTVACVVDIGAQKTSICCVEEGMCVDESRANLKIGGFDVTQCFIKMMLFDHFPYAEMNLNRRYDYLLAEELKHKICTFNNSDITVQLFDFHLRVSGQNTRKYNFKTYDEPILAPMGFFQPNIFDNEGKMAGRRKLVERSYDIYDDEKANDPESKAQRWIIDTIAPPPPPKPESSDPDEMDGVEVMPLKPAPAISRLNHLDDTGSGTPSSSRAGSLAPDGTSSTPQPHGSTPVPGAGTTNGASTTSKPPTEAAMRDDVLPIFALDQAIMTSITCASRGDDRKLRDFLGSIMVVGGGSQIAGFTTFLEERMRSILPANAKDIIIGVPPRELDPSVVVWKGASVFGKLRGTEDVWVGQAEYEKLGERVLAHRCLWNW